jgi:hypothetical protein
VLVYGQAGAEAPRQLTWFDRSGQALGTAGDPAPYVGVTLSPDERHAAVTLETGSPENIDIWLMDLARNIRSRLTVHPGQDVSPLWSPDARGSCSSPLDRDRQSPCVSCRPVRQARTNCSSKELAAASR